MCKRKFHVSWEKRAGAVGTAELSWAGDRVLCIWGTLAALDRSGSNWIDRDLPLLPRCAPFLHQDEDEDEDADAVWQLATDVVVVVAIAIFLPETQLTGAALSPKDNDNAHFLLIFATCHPERCLRTFLNPVALSSLSPPPPPPLFCAPSALSFLLLLAANVFWCVRKRIKDCRQRRTNNEAAERGVQISQCICVWMSVCVCVIGAAELIAKWAINKMK